MEHNYKRELNYLTIGFNQETQQMSELSMTKTATFSELSRLVKKQNKLQWKIMETMESSNIEEDSQVRINSAALCDLIYKYVKEMLVCDENFTQQDKDDFLQDNGAVMQFGLWALNEKIAPFFSKLMNS